MNQSPCRDAFLASVSELEPLLSKHKVNLNFMPHPGGFIEESDGTLDLIREAGVHQSATHTA